jgi:hypothetical protein
MSTSRFGTSVLSGSWRSMAPKDFSISASWSLYACRLAALRALASSVLHSSVSWARASSSSGRFAFQTKYQ